MSVQPPQLCAFTRSDPSQDTPNLHYHVSPISSDRFGGPLHKWPGLSCGIAVVRPQSIGYVRIKSAGSARASGDPAQLPGDAGSAPRRDRRNPHARARSCTARRLRASSRRKSCRAPNCESDDEILAYARQTVITVFHQSGSCKMGHDPMAVVDDRLRVHGLEGLRVIDASIMPNVISGNTNAPTMMIGEKGAAMIRAGSPGRGGGSVSYFRFSNSNIA